LLELGMDYMSAGLYDRAENLFTELFETGKLQKKALENLKEIYQQEKVWDKCLQVVKQLENYTHKSYSEEIAHYYCEMADIAKKSGDIQKAENLIRTAKQSKADSVRALMMEAEFSIKHENYQQALKTYQQIFEKDRLFISEILQQMIICYKQVKNQKELLPFLNDLYDKTQDAAVLDEIIEYINFTDGSSAAIDYLVLRLEKHPSLKGLRQLVSLQTSLSITQDSPNPKENERILLLFKDTIDSVLSSGHAYGCYHCGFAAKTLHWQCPGCRSWGTIKPSRDIDKANALSVSS